MDERDWAILKALLQDGRKSLTELARMLGVSHTAVAKRMAKLPIKVRALLSKKLFKAAALVLMEVRSYEDMRDIEERFKDCPRILLLVRLMGYGCAALVLAEDESVLKSIMTECAVRIHPGVRSSQVLVVEDIVNQDYLPVNLKHYRELEKPPCGLVGCTRCKRFLENSCLGCPAIKDYKGPL